MRRCAAVVNSSLSEGMSGALLEAMAVCRIFDITNVTPCVA
eukprot:SAG11_NODE_32096_length_286_cov_1.080214_1_plen_41_part_00